MMVEVRQNGGKGEMADGHAAFARLADASAKLFAEQAVAMAAMTAFGISIAGQMTGLMLGTFKPSDDGVADMRSDGGPMSMARADGNVVHLRSMTEEGDSVADAASKAVGNVYAAPAAEIERGRPEFRAKTARPAKAAPRRAAVAKAVSKVDVAKPAPSAAESAADDLKRISGIGPRLEKVLNSRGISTYADIASLGKAALKKIDDELGLEGRVIRDDWVGQAKVLAAGGSDAAR